MKNHCPKKSPKKRETTTVKKRICTIIFALLIAFLLVGCKAKDSKPSPEINPTSQNEPVTSEAGTSVMDVPSEQPSGQDQKSAAERFVGVMGSEFMIPEGFIQLDENPSIGYQYTFWHPDQEIRIVVYEIAPGYIPEGAYEIYSKESSTDNGLKTFWITYPTAKREYGDSITAEFEKHFRF